MKNQVVIIANSLRGLGLSRRESFLRAWAVIRLEQASKEKPVRFAYVKEKGEIREAIAYSGNEFSPTRERTSTKAAPKPYVRTYWDTTSGGVRSYRADRLILH